MKRENTGRTGITICLKKRNRTETKRILKNYRESKYSKEKAVEHYTKNKEATKEKSGKI